MKEKVLVTLCASLLLVTFPLMANESGKKVLIKKSNIVTTTIGVKGMTCVGCEVTLEKSIKKLQGVVTVKASASSKHAVIAYDKTKTDETTVTQLIKEMGYKPFNIVQE